MVKMGYAAAVADFTFAQYFGCVIDIHFCMHLSFRKIVFSGIMEAGLTRDDPV